MLLGSSRRHGLPLLLRRSLLRRSLLGLALLGLALPGRTLLRRTRNVRLLRALRCGRVRLRRDRLCGHLRQADRLQNLRDDVLGRYLVCEGVVGQHEAVPKHVGDDLEDVLRYDVVAPANQCECT